MSLAGPFGPGRLGRLGKNSMRYFRLISILWSDFLIRHTQVRSYMSVGEYVFRHGEHER